MLALELPFLQLTCFVSTLLLRFEKKHVVSLACARCFDFAFKLDQDKCAKIRKYVAMIQSLSLVYMVDVIHSAPWLPWLKSAILPAALLQRNRNTSPSQIRS
jgi:hypothetical protein